VALCPLLKVVRIVRIRTDYSEVAESGKHSHPFYLLKPDVHKNNVELKEIILYLAEKICVSVMKANWLILFREIITFCFENNVFTFKSITISAGGIYIYICSLKV
jgi:hypothetical protein